MTTAGIAIILTLVGILIGILGWGGGRMTSDKKLNAVKAELIARCDDCFIPCREERVKQEKSLQQAIETLTNILQFQVQPRLIEGSFIMAAIAEAAGVSKEKIKEIKDNVRNGNLT